MIYHNYFEKNSISLQINTPISSSFRLLKLARGSLWVLGVTWWCTGFITSCEELHGTKDLTALGTHYPKETDNRGFAEHHTRTPVSHTCIGGMHTSEQPEQSAFLTICLWQQRWIICTHLVQLIVFIGKNGLQKLFSIYMPLICYVWKCIIGFHAMQSFYDMLHQHTDASNLGLNA